MASNDEDLEGKLDTLIRLTALQLIGTSGQTEGIKMLARSGMDTSVIAEVVGTTPGTVRSTLARARRSKPKGRPARK
jgi:DNA-directed RNA polymerase specialized sigma24 family protein